MSIELIYEDKDLLVVNKPPGLLCVPGLSDPDNLHQRVQNYDKNARVVHRLDMATSGLVIFARHHEAQKAMGKLFEQRQIAKQYVAVVHGQIQQRHGEIASPMICDWPQRPKQKIDWLEGKKALTRYQRLKSDCKTTRLALFPVTGRTHQLRLHMLQLGHPILGDQFYHSDGSEHASARLLLHAEKLNFQHPNGKAMALLCPAAF
ncbi:RluA family pseudouridine synthase [Agaribacterium haliotis]|uniref:RluA family pseudouridine synthase n=1 Tax=Agaribacterium haliotis TaxID=2013869 RepID=UPI000BB54690|nr:RluA family pseudouridine synthase [Agaribacterium haliotis]